VVIAIALIGDEADGAVLLLCGPRCLTLHHADPHAPPGRWSPAEVSFPWCTFCARCGMRLLPRARTGCWLCTPAAPCARWPRTAQAAHFARTATARLAGPVPDELWAVAGELADRIPDGGALAELLTPRPSG
jgi:hypothetical protein